MELGYETTPVEHDLAKPIITISVLVDLMGKEHTLSEIVQNAMGQSVTPSRLKDSRDPGFLERLFGDTTIPGPFYTDLQPGESLHYIFRSNTEVILAEEEDPDSEDHTIIRGEAIMPGVVVVTDQRTIFYYIGEDERTNISIKHADLVNIEFNDGMLFTEMNQTTTQRTVETSISLGSSYSSELSDAVAYIADQADIKQDTTGSNFESGNVDSAKSTLIDQLSNVDGIRDQIDIMKVAEKAANGAALGIKRGKVTGVLGLVVFGGIEMYNQIDNKGESRVSVEDLDPEETAEEIAKWQKLGRSSGYDGMELASGALGATISVDKQTSGRKASRVLSNLDIDWDNGQLKDGNQKEAALQIASEAVEAYSTEISWLSDQQKSNNNESS